MNEEIVKEEYLNLLEDIRDALEDIRELQEECGEEMTGKGL